MVTFFVNKPGNLTNPKRLKKLNDFVDELESVNGSWGKIGTQYFVREFIEFQKVIGFFLILCF